MIGERLKELRKDKGLSQKELADQLSIGWKTVSSYETGNSSPDDDMKVAIARFFNVSLDYLLGLIDEEVPYTRDHFIALPKGYTQELKRDVQNYMEFLKMKETKK